MDGLLRQRRHFQDIGIKSLDFRIKMSFHIFLGKNTSTLNPNFALKLIFRLKAMHKKMQCKICLRLNQSRRKVGTGLTTIANAISG